MTSSTLGDLIQVLEHGSRIRIFVAFFSGCGNRYMLCSRAQMFHESPVCLAAKRVPGGLASCYRCRKIVGKKARRSRVPFGGYCVKGVYEYCRPILYQERVIGVIFIGNILTPDPAQRGKLLAHVPEELLDTMEPNYTPEDCAAAAEVLHSYIVLLLDKYGDEGSEFSPLVINIQNYIRENLTEEPSLEELARVFNYNKKYLGQRFKAGCGYSVREYCNQLRVEQAKELLDRPGLSISNIAQQLGYSNVTYFERVFRRITGVPPRVYRCGKQDGGK